MVNPKTRIEVVTGHILTGTDSSSRTCFIEAAGVQALPRTWSSSSSPLSVPTYTPVLPTAVSKSSDVFKKRQARNLDMIEEIHRRFEVIKLGGGGKSLETHYKRGKLLPRDRIRAIIDEGTDFMELSTFAMWNMAGGTWHSGGFITAIGVVAGREVVFLCNDSTIKGGTGGAGLVRAQEISLENCLPAIYLVDGGGAKLDAQASGPGGKKDSKAPKRDLSYEGTLPAFFTAGGKAFYNQCRLESVGIPQIAVTLGGATAGAAYFVALCQENIIVQGNGKVYLGGPPLVKAATGEDADDEEVGGAKMHTMISGTVDHYAPDEISALAKCRSVIENLGGKARTVLPNMAVPELPLYDMEELLGIIPENNTELDICEVIARIVDGSRFHQFKADYGPSLVCGWAHIEGYPVGIIGNNGLISGKSMIKATQFIQMCGSRTTPLVFLQNAQGFEVGLQAEAGTSTNSSVVKAGALMINALTNVPVPKFSIVVGDSIGAANFVMCGPRFHPRFTFVWPNARVAPMTPEHGGDMAVYDRQQTLRDAGGSPLSDEDAEALRMSVMDRLSASSSAWHSTAGCYDDGIIDPRDTRKYLTNCISIALNAPMGSPNHSSFSA